MEFIIDKKRLDSVVSLLANYVEKKDNSSTNSNIAINTQEDAINLKASDSEMGISYTIRGCKIINPGEIYINAKKLNDILKGLDNKDISIKKIDKSVKISQDKTKFKLPIMAEKDFIFMNETEARQEINLSSTALAKGLRMINPAIDNNSISAQFSCAHIEITPEQIAFVGSDSKIVSVYAINSNFNQNEQIIISKRSVTELLKLLNEEARIYKTENYFLIENDNFTFYTKTANIHLLPYKAVMPKHEIKQQVKLPTKIITQEIKKLNTISETCSLSFLSDNKIIFKNNPYNSVDNDTAVTSELELNLNINENFEIFLANKYMLDFLNLADEEEFTLSYFAPAAPVIFQTTHFIALIACIKN